MPTAISESFDSIRQLTGYDLPGTDVPSVDPDLATVLANVVQNLRSFSHEIDRDREMGDLDDATQVTPLPLLPAGMDGDTNTHVELFPRIQDEDWISDGSLDAPASTGITGDITYGEQLAYNNWKGGKVVLAGGAAELWAESVMTGLVLDLTG